MPVKKGPLVVIQENLLNLAIVRLHDSVSAMRVQYCTVLTGQTCLHLFTFFLTGIRLVTAVMYLYAHSATVVICYLLIYLSYNNHIQLTMFPAYDSSSSL